MLEKMVAELGAFLFGPIMLLVYFGVGMLFTIRLGGVQFIRFGVAMKECVLNIKGSGSGEGVGQIKSFEALATALSSCVGIGNIVGVSSAIALGGPGAVFWMLVAGLVGMATKFAEICLAMHYREKDEQGNFRGGTMYVLTRGLNNSTISKFLGGMFAICAVATSVVSMGSLQVNTVGLAVNSVIATPDWVVAIVILIFDGLVIFGGLTKIAQITGLLTPVMAIIYLGFGSIILLMHVTEIPGAIVSIVQAAFCGDAVVGGVAGATMATAIRRGVSRGVFSNEAGMGSSSIVHATATVPVPTKQSLYGIIEVFFDTLVVCLFTALIIMVCGDWRTGITDGAKLASLAFTKNLGAVGNFVLAISLILFCLSTLIGWYTYGETCFVFLFGTKGIIVYRIMHMVFAAGGAVLGSQFLWDLADCCNGLMAIPNLISLVIFSSVVTEDTKEFFAQYDAENK